MPPRSRSCIRTPTPTLGSNPRFLHVNPATEPLESSRPGPPRVAVSSTNPSPETRSLGMRIAMQGLVGTCTTDSLRRRRQSRPASRARPHWRACPRPPPASSQTCSGLRSARQPPPDTPPAQGSLASLTALTSGAAASIVRPHPPET